MSTERELIQRLADALAGWQLGGAPPEDTADADLITEARAYLTQPEPEGPPEDEELLEIAAKALGYKSIPSDEICTASAGKLLAYGRAVLAAGDTPPSSRCLRGVTGEGIRDLLWQHTSDLGDNPIGVATEDAPALIYAALTRWGRTAVKPVPVAERPWEREGWCDAEGRCWAGYPGFEYSLGDTGDFDACDPEWQLVDPSYLINTTLPIVLLPHHALPVPNAEPSPPPKGCQTGTHAV